jgi:sugar fermentation stimulation protein A
MVASEGTWVGINTGRSNTIVAEALLRGSITEIAPVESLKKEVRTSTGNRLDLVAVSNGVDTYIEVKNCTYVEDRCALFPDAVTARGTKHLQELTRLVQAGRRAVIFFLVQRLDADRFAPAGNIDPLYAETLSTAQAQGVEVLAYQAAVSPTAIDIVRPLPLDLTLSL